jgi:hypothetical protein
MSFFKKRSGAIVVLLVIIVFGSLFAANRSLGAKVQAINDQLYTQIYDSSVGYALPSVASQLKVRCSASQNLFTVGSSYTEAAAETTALRDARRVLMDLLDKSSKAKALYAANSNLGAAFDALYTKLGTLTLSDGQKTIILDSKSNMSGAATQIEKSGYNEAVRKFNRETLSQFPTNFLKSITFVKEPDLFE